MKNKKLNLVEILKDAPKGTKLYSPICGELEFDRIEPTYVRSICCRQGEDYFLFSKEGEFYRSNGAEILLFPSKENKDWSTFKIRKQSVTERIKTFSDACKELGRNHPYVAEYDSIIKKVSSKDLAAYLKLRIIAAALNEGWQPQFVKGDGNLYCPWFVLLTKNGYDSLDDDEKGRCVLRSGGNSYPYYVFVSVFASYGIESTNGSVGAQLALKTRELAKYIGEQFFDIWVDYFYNI